MNPIKAKITNEEDKKLAQPITFAELKTAIFQLENGISPEIDGIPIEFYKFYYEYIKTIYYNFTTQYFSKTTILQLQRTRQ